MKHYTVRQTAEMLAVSEKTVRRMIKRGELRCRRVGSLIRIPASELESHDTRMIPLPRSA